MIPMSTDDWEFYHISGQGYNLRFKGQSHPTAFINKSGTTFFEDMNSGRVTYIEPKAKIEFIHYTPGNKPFAATELLHYLLIRYFSLGQQIQWNYSQLFSAPLSKLVEEVKMLWYIDLIREYYFTHAVEHGCNFSAMRFTSTELWFLAEGGMCKCGMTRKRCQGQRWPHKFKPDFTYGISEFNAHLLMSETKIHPGGYKVEV